MNKISRRTFAKRSGAATLGTALGLGMLPSLTRKLHAEDTSAPPGGGGYGVEALWADDSISESWQVHGGTLTITITQSCSSPKDVCAPTLCMHKTRNATYVKYKDGKTYKGSLTRTDNYYWHCVYGVATLFYAHHTGPITTAVANVNDPNDTCANLSAFGEGQMDGTTAGYYAKIGTPGLGWSEECHCPPLVHVVICCTL